MALKKSSEVCYYFGVIMDVSQNLASRRCVPCEGGAKPMRDEEVTKYLSQLSGWTADRKMIRKEYTFKNFVDAMKFSNRVTEIAEQERHHPDLHISYGKVIVELWTHAIDGLSENDFILAAKIDELRGS